MIVVPHPASPARRWLAHLVRAAEGSSRAGDLFDDDLPFEAAAVASLARQQGVAPLVHRGLDLGRIADPLPETFRAACQSSYSATQRANRVALDAGRAIQRGLAEAGIAAAPLAGWALLEDPAPTYPDPGTRPLEALDLFVPAVDCRLAADALEWLGLRAVPRKPGSAPVFHQRESGVDLLVALHSSWARAEGSARAADGSGERFLAGLCESTEFAVYRPTRLGSLLVAAVHAARHAPPHWIWLVDLHRLVSTAPPDWDAVIAAAREWRVRGPLYAGLLATRELLRTPIPKEVLARLAPGLLRRRLLHRSLAASAADGAAPGRGWAARVLLGDSWWEIARRASGRGAVGAAVAPGAEPLFPIGRRARAPGGET